MQDLYIGPKFARISRNFDIIRQNPVKIPKNIGVFVILGLYMNLVFYLSEFLGILGLYRIYKGFI